MADPIVTSANTPGVTSADEHTLLEFAKKLDGPLQILQGDLKKLGGAQDELRVAFVGVAGDAIFNAFGNVQSTGTDVARYLEEILNSIKKSAADYSSEDQAAMESLMKSIDGGLKSNGLGSVDGSFGAAQTGATEGWATSQNEKVRMDW